MHRHAILSARLAVAIAFGLVVATGIVGCSSSTTEPELTMPDFEGTYSVLGTYTGRPGNRLNGTLVVSDQQNESATVEISVILDDAGNVSFALNETVPDIEATAGPSTATLGTDGSFDVSYTGREVISGLDPASCCTFTYRLRGTLDGDRISGTWTLSRDMPSFDSGTFTATR